MKWRKLIIFAEEKNGGISWNFSVRSPVAEHRNKLKYKKLLQIYFFILIILGNNDIFCIFESEVLKARKHKI